MDKEIKKQIVFVLEDDNEVMAAALEPHSDLDKRNKQMNMILSHFHRVNLNAIVHCNLFKQLSHPFLNISPQYPFAVLRCPNQVVPRIIDSMTRSS